MVRVSLISLVIVAWLLAERSVPASDHADPIDPLNRERLEGGLTDLFVFPVMENDEPAFPYGGNQTIPLSGPLPVREELTPEQRSRIDAIVIILCARRALTQSGSLMLSPYTYRIHLDLNHPLRFPQSDPANGNRPPQPTAATGYGDQPAAAGMKNRPTPHEAVLRYGAVIENPDSIDEEVVIEFELDNKAQLKPGFPKFVRPDDTPYPRWNSRSMKVASGVYDDPFIFPAFFGTNIVGMAVRIPIELFPEKQALLIWATSHKGRRQVDHVGRSLRTQNPRFELLNTLHPKEHVQAILREHEHPSLMRDIFLRLNFAQTFAYRRWDMVPDVMVFTTQYPVGFPNGRLLTDDVSALLAQYGDTLLYELSYQHNNGDWPRQTTNDGMASREFKKTFPYLLEPAPDGPPPPPLRLTTASILKLLGVFLVLALLFILENWIVAHWYYRYKTRRRYL